MPEIGVLNLSVSGLRAQQARVDAVGHNLANAQTPGFRAIRPELVDLPANQGVYGETAPTRLVTADDPSQGVAVAQINRPDLPGVVIATNAPLDVALPPGVYLSVQLPDGRVTYTRDGHLSLGADGGLQIGEYRLAGKVRLPPNAADPQVGAGGEIVARVNGQPTVVGQLPLVTVPHPEQLKEVNRGLFTVTAESGAPRTAGAKDLAGLTPGALEGSNVQLDTEMTEMLRAQRIYGANAQMVHTWDQLAGDSIQELSRP